MRKSSKAGHAPCLQGRQHSNMPDDFKGADRLMDLDVMILLGKFKVDAFLYESVQAHLNEMLPHLLKGGIYSAQEILGEHFWADMAMPQHLPTLCLKHLAEQPGAKLSVASWSGPEATDFQIN